MWDPGGANVTFHRADAQSTDARADKLGTVSPYQPVTSLYTVKELESVAVIGGSGVLSG